MPKIYISRDEFIKYKLHDADTMSMAELLFPKPHGLAGLRKVNECLVAI